MGERAPPRRPASYDDVLAAPEDLLAEIVDGELVTSPRPSGERSLASSSMNATLGPPFQFGDGGPGGWWILFEPELHLGGHVLVPDLAGWRKERMPEPPREPFFTMTPDWVCEVLSPATARRDRIRKLPVYARLEVRHAWLIDPALRTLEAFRLEAGSWVVVGMYGEDAKVRVEPFEAVEIAMGRLWGG